MDKESFLIYKSFYEPISAFSNEQLGRLFRAIFVYQISGKENQDADIAIAFKFFKNQFRLDDIKYQEICEKRRENGKKGGRPKKANGFEESKRFSEKPKKADNDNEKENENDNENDNEKENVCLMDSAVADATATKTKRNDFIPPTLSDVRAYAVEINAPEDEAEAFVDYFTSVGWKASNGRKLVDWKSAFRNWNRNSKKRYSHRQSSSSLSRTEIPHAGPGEFKDTLL